MILVDTSVLIDWLKGKENLATLKFDKIVKTDSPFGISILSYQELLQGAKNNLEFEKLRSYFGTQKIFYLPDDLSFFDQASEMYRILRQSGKTIRSTIDVLIAMTSIHYNLALLHNDKDFQIIASEFEKLILFD